MMEQNKTQQKTRILHEFVKLSKENQWHMYTDRVLSDLIFERNSLW